MKQINVQHVHFPFSYNSQIKYLWTHVDAEFCFGVWNVRSMSVRNFQLHSVYVYTLILSAYPEYLGVFSSQICNSNL
jgi:hypothetical protein